MNPKINYKIRSAKLKDIIQHLNICSKNFLPPLNEKIDIPEYAKKIFKHAVTFEAWSSDVLAGLVAVYYNDSEKNIGFITNVSTVNEYSGKGIASELIRMSLNFGMQEGFNEILLEVAKDNLSAIKLYKKFMFSEEHIKGENLILKYQLIKEIN